MFDFFFKRKEIVLDCFTTVPPVYDYSPISYAIKFVPDWWKKTPILNDGMATIRNCLGFTELYKNAIVIPCWSAMDFFIDDKNKKTFEWRTSLDWRSVISDELISTHSNEQFFNFTGNHGLNLKIISPWMFKTNKFVNFSWSQPTWNVRDRIFNANVLPAVTNFYTQNSTHINIFFEHQDEKQKITFEWLNPLVMLHPLSDNKIKIQNHLISETEMQRFLGRRFLFFRSGPENQIKSIKINNKLKTHYERIGNCPHKPKVEESK